MKGCVSFGEQSVPCVNDCCLFVCLFVKERPEVRGGAFHRAMGFLSR
jgi:hypothetical protein